jgi:hypothetical protein
MGKGTRDRQAEAERCHHAQEEDDVRCGTQEDRRRSASAVGESEGGSEEDSVGKRGPLAMGKFSPTKQLKEGKQPTWERDGVAAK